MLKHGIQAQQIHILYIQVTAFVMVCDDVVCGLP
jgi:hypothetical protein